MTARRTLASCLLWALTKTAWATAAAGFTLAAAERRPEVWLS